VAERLTPTAKEPRSEQTKGPSGERAARSAELSNGQLVLLPGLARAQVATLDAAPPAVVPAAKLSAQEQLLRHLPAEQLAAELRHRGWAVTEPVTARSPVPAETSLAGGDLCRAGALPGARP